MQFRPALCIRISHKSAIKEQDGADVILVFRRFEATKRMLCLISLSVVCLGFGLITDVRHQFLASRNHERRGDRRDEREKGFWIYIRRAINPTTFDKFVRLSVKERRLNKSINTQREPFEFLKNIPFTVSKQKITFLKLFYKSSLSLPPLYHFPQAPPLFPNSFTKS